MLFMVIERFADGDMVPAYARLRERGRSLPAGLEYVGSWVEARWALAGRGTGVALEIVGAYLEPPAGAA